MQLGTWRLDSIDAGRFRMDGGVVYGVVPKSIWHTVSPADPRNTIPLAARCFLARNDRLNVLIECGFGDKLSKLDRASRLVEAPGRLVASLADKGVRAEEIDIVVLSHLHWDHAGGATTYDAHRQPVPTFPRAKYYVNRIEWECASNPRPEAEGGYVAADFLPLLRTGQVEWTDGDQTIAPGLAVRVTGGHTQGHQAVLVESGGQTACLLADICPTSAHVRRMWCTAYDHFPLDTRRRKAEMLTEAIDGGWWILWGHDPDFAASRIARRGRRDFATVDSVVHL